MATWTSRAVAELSKDLEKVRGILSVEDFARYEEALTHFVSCRLPLAKFDGLAISMLPKEYIDVHYALCNRLIARFSLPGDELASRDHLNVPAKLLTNHKLPSLGHTRARFILEAVKKGLKDFDDKAIEAVHIAGRFLMLNLIESLSSKVLPTEPAAEDRRQKRPDVTLSVDQLLESLHEPFSDGAIPEPVRLKWVEPSTSEDKEKKSVSCDESKTKKRKPATMPKDEAKRTRKS